jgi:hypothetical protein
MHDLGCACIAPQGVTLPEDAVRWEAHRIHNEQLWEERQRRRGWSATWSVMRARGEESPSEPESSGGGVEEEDEDEEPASRDLRWHALAKTAPNGYRGIVWPAIVVWSHAGFF